MEAEARGPPELLFYQRHEVQWGPLFDGQCFLLVREEVLKELIATLTHSASL